MWWWYAVAAAVALLLAVVLWRALRPRRPRERLEIDAFERTRSLTSSWAGSESSNVREAHVERADADRDGVADGAGDSPVRTPGDPAAGPA